MKKVILPSRPSSLNIGKLAQAIDFRMTYYFLCSKSSLVR